MIYSIVCTDTTATGHIADRPVEQLHVGAVGGNELELVDLRSKETLAPEATGIPEEMTGVVTTTINVGLELNHPDTLGITSRTVLIVGAEQIVEHVAILLGLRTETLGHQGQVGVVDNSRSGIHSLVVSACCQVGLGQQHVGGWFADLTILYGVDLGQIGYGILQVFDHLSPYLVFRLACKIGLGGCYLLNL